MQSLIKYIQSILGLEIYLVGGGVRNFLLNLQVKDFDFTTPSSPDEVEEAIKKAGFNPYVLGKRFGTVGFKLDLQNYSEKNFSGGKKHELIEITSFRSEKYASGSRKPEVIFVKSLKEDLSRRDFTINSMAMDKHGQIFDYYGGQKDLQSKRICAVGNPQKRFSEDPLRMLRAIRFATQFKFEIEAKTMEAIQKKYFTLINISKERWVMEMDKILSLENVKDGLNLLKKSGLLNIIIPELTVQFDYNQNSKYHDFDLWRHTCNVTANCPRDNLNLRWAALLHDIAKPFTCTFDDKQKRNHFISHDLVGADLAEMVCRRLKFSNERTKFITETIKTHLQSDSILKIYDDAGKKLPQGFIRQKIIVIGGGDSFENYDQFLKAFSTEELRLGNFRSWKNKLKSILEPEFEVFNLPMPNTNNAKYLEWKIQFEKLLRMWGINISSSGDLAQPKNNCESVSKIKETNQFTDKSDLEIEIDGQILNATPIILVGWSLGGIFLAKYLAENNLNFENKTSENKVSTKNILPELSNSNSENLSFETNLENKKLNKVFPIKQLHLVAAPFEKCGDFELPKNLSKLSEQVEKIYLYHSTDDFVVDFNESQKYLQHPDLKGKIEFVKFTDRNHFLQNEFVELMENINQILAK